MIRSMTGFGRGVFVREGREYLVEIKTVNHRYMDISIRLPRAYNYLEGKIRESLSRRIVRGKVDVSVWIDDFGTTGRTVLLDEGLADLYVDSLKKIRQRYDINEEISLSLLCRFPEVLRVKKEEEDEDTVWNELQVALTEAADSLITMREEEGTQLKSDLLDKTVVLDELVSGVEARASSIVLDYRTRLQNRIKDLLADTKIDEGRLEIEVALFADRCSVEEEVIRLRSHTEQFRQILSSSQVVGRKLDFVIQEMNREINTIGSKANNLEITKMVVEAKSEIEKMREQVQNIE